MVKRALDWETPFFTTIKLVHKGLVTKTYEAERLVTVVNRLYELGVFERNVRLAAIEDYAYGIKNDQTNCTFSLGELGGCVRYHLFTRCVPYLNVPIQTNKQFATGNGSAKKPQVASCMAAIWGLPPFRKDQYDASDALALATVAAYKYYKYTLPGLQSYQFQRGITEKLEVVCGQE